MLLTTGSLGNQAIRTGLDAHPELRAAAEAVRHKPDYRPRHRAATDSFDGRSATTVVVDAAHPRRIWTKPRRVTPAITELAQAIQCLPR